MRGLEYPERHLRLEIVYVAALALLLEQLRECAPTTDMLNSVQRLSTLAHVGSVTIDAATLAEAAAIDATADGAAVLRDLLDRHGIVGIDIASTVTDTEFLKLGGLLVGTPSAVPGAILESVDAMGIWNIRLRVPGRALRPTPAGMRALADVVPHDVSHDGGLPDSSGDDDARIDAGIDAGGMLARPGAPAPASATGPSPVERPAAFAQAVERGDGMVVCQQLSAVGDAALFERMATPDALQLLVDLLLDAPDSHDAVHRLLIRAGLPGARAVFEQLIAVTELADRRVLYDVAASLPATMVVARQYAHDPTWYVVRNAAGLLGESRNQAAIVDLARLLRHPDTRVRVAAVVALGQIGGPAAMARLESVLFDSVPDVRNRALSIVFAAPDADPLVDRMTLAIQEERAFEYQLEIIAALSHVHTPRARRKLVEYATNTSRSPDDLELRLAAIGALAAGHRPAADSTLRALAADEQAEVRERATVALQGR
ncbi:HEAT repeat domain-containing protein [Gemmatimonas sp.]|uniref:HEAT repeat domain-containing protein n=1 Tax=Gemmatimonas sp. TaxID=1962908 RepID=UPI0022BFBA6E|nr:HEAT repeat domain-containing protein [Gemmatimonas sp.]MCZ8203144.1 HEAT repeat domain-containing protein [Gemmatimonas sp.]